MSQQQLVILARSDGAAEGEMPPLGSREDIVERLLAFNTAPEVEGADILYGPGIRIELPPGDPVTQMLLTVTEEEIAWLSIMRLVKSLNWKLLDPMSGRELSP